MSVLVKELTSLGAPSGFEDAVREFIKERICADEVYTDSMGNLICHKKGNGEKVMVAAHMDEVGLIITEITDNGFLRFSTLGGIETAVLCSKKVLIGKNAVAGIVSAKAIHLQKGDEVTSPLKLKDLYIDIGARDKESAEKLVSQGDFAVFNGEYTPFGDKLVKSKALDDRVGCAIVLELSKEDFDSDMYFVFTVQEEVGLRGAKTASALIAPDLAVAVDVSNVGDTPESMDMNLSLGKGPAVKMKDASFIIHESVRKLLLDAAKESGIPYQLEAASYGGTDAGAIHLSGGGVASGTISIPTRYIHSANEVIDKKDLENTAILLQKVIEISADKYILF